MKRSTLVIALLTMLIGGIVPAAAAADLEASWGTGGVGSYAVPAGTKVADTAPLTDGGIVAVGHGVGQVPWAAIVTPDGSSITTLSGFSMADTQFKTVTTGGNRIYAIGDVDLGIGFSTVVAVFDLSGVFIDSHTFIINQDTVPTSAAMDGSGRLFIAGTGRGDADGGEHAWVVRLTADGVVDSSYPTLFLEPPDAGTTNPVAYVGTTAGQAVAVVTGDGAPTPGASIGFHRVTDSGSIFMADFTSARAIVDADIDSSSGQAVFGSLTPAASLTAANYLIHSISATGVPDVTSSGTWIDVAGRIEVGRLRTDSLLGAGEGDVNTFVELVQSGTHFAGRSDAELIDIATSPLDGGVYVSMWDVDAGLFTIAKYAGDDSGRFIDDDSSVHETDIERLDELEITRGCNPPVNDRFCPAANVTRGQMAAFLRRAVILPTTTMDYFDDDNGSVFENDINAIAAAGITLGCNPPVNDNYCPTANVTREQMASFIVRAVDG